MPDFKVLPSVNGVAVALADHGHPPPGLSLWLDASQITGLADAAAVATWEDASGAGLDATQATGAARPSYKTGIVNGRPVVRFDGGDYLASALSAAPAARTMLVVAYPTDFSAARTLLGASGNAGLQFRADASTGTLQLISQNTALLGGASVAATAAAWQVLEASNVNGGAWSFGRNGVAGGAGTSASTLSATTTHIGGANTLEPWLGDIAEVLCYDRVLLYGERQQALAYLGAKYGIAVTLTDHVHSFASMLKWGTD